ncbi:hypothetical protein J2X65_003511 [Ancylobacter sp. 3268]|uniref:hypothetical protein n=1 Tax=Ancylobacter sp. 3268 TaxID=2817752 RepID=UPI002864CB74|nr:hypothetical protein [Ancylobacter sp. 3268]MDR6954143.1 hypothetical protein [Ancylobacter sp. 3268]
MKPAIPYVYRVSRRQRARRNRWTLSVIPPHGQPDILARYGSRRQAVEAADILASCGGMVEVRS